MKRLSQRQAPQGQGGSNTIGRVANPREVGQQMPCGVYPKLLESHVVAENTRKFVRASVLVTRASFTHCKAGETSIKDYIQDEESHEGDQQHRLFDQGPQMRPLSGLCRKPPALRVVVNYSSSDSSADEPVTDWASSKPPGASSRNSSMNPRPATRFARCNNRGTGLAGSFFS